MTDRRTWAKSDREIFELLFLEWLNDAPDVLRVVSAFVEAIEGLTLDRKELRAIAEASEAIGQVVIHRVLAGVLASSAMLTTAGRARVQEAKLNRENPTVRAVACRDALLDWLVKEKHGGNRSSNISQFLSDPRSYFEGRQFELRDIDNATLILRDRGMVRGQGSMGGGVPRPELTAVGEEVVEVWDGSTAKYLQAQAQPGTQMVQNIYGGQGAIAGRDVHQHQTNSGGQPEELLLLLQAVKDAAAGLGNDEGTRVMGVVQVIQDEVSSDDPDRTLIQSLTDKLKSLASKVGDVAVTAAAQAAIKALTE